MKEIHLGRVLVANRHKRGITQDELAEHIGVSKAAVSKWETETTYPDITLLPQLASFFDISMDELMGYEPHMPKEEIQKLYRKLSAEFSTQPFDEVLEQCRDTVKKYFSCYPLLFQIGALLVNHSMLAKEQEKTEKVLEEARDLFIRVKTESNDIELAKQALNMEALCQLSLGRPVEVLDLLDQPGVPLMSPEPLLASAYQMTGKSKEAKSILQTGIYQYLVGLFNLLSSYLGLCPGDPAAFEQTLSRTLAIAEAFQVKALHPSLLMSFYLLAAQGCMAFGNREKALTLLEEYTDLVTGNIYPLHLHGDQFFNLLDEWLEDALILGDTLPRDESIIRQSMTESVSCNPAFASLADDPCFRKLVHRLKQNEVV